MYTPEYPRNYVSRSTIQEIGRSVAASWGRRKGTGVLLEAARHKETLSRLVWELDVTIERFNENWLNNPAVNTSDFWNVRALMGYLKNEGKRLPPLQRDTGCGPSELRGFWRALRDVRPQMELYEETGAAKQGLTFGVRAAEANDDDKRYQAVFGGTIQVVGRYLVGQLSEDPDRLISVERGAGNLVEVDLKTVIMDALLEAPVLEGDLNGFGYFTAAREMGWYDSSEEGGPFSPVLSAQVASLSG